LLLIYRELNILCVKYSLYSPYGDDVIKQDGASSRCHITYTDACVQYWTTVPLRLPVCRTGERVDNAPDCQSVESRRPQGDPVVHSATASELLEHRQLQRCRRDHQRTQVSDRTL